MQTKTNKQNKQSNNKLKILKQKKQQLKDQRRETEEPRQIKHHNNKYCKQTCINKNKQKQTQPKQTNQ